MKRRILWLAITLLTFTLALWSADITGKWTAQVPGRSGNMREVTFMLKASGENLTGTMSGRNGDIQIADGKISFDYHMRPGIVQKSNAIELMRQVGLEI